MKERDIGRDELERKLRAYFEAEDREDGMEPPSDMWERLSSLLGQQKRRRVFLLPSPPPLGLPGWRLRGVYAILAAVFVVALVGVVVVWSLGLLSPVHRIQFVPEKAFAAAYDALLSVHTVSYAAKTEISHGTCSVGFNVPLTEVELNALPPERRPADGRGIIVGCAPEPQRYIEEGAYDMDQQAFHARMSAASQSNMIEVNPMPNRLQQGLERVYVDGTLYFREGDEDWREQPTSAQWVPFDTGSIGGIPSGGLDALRQTYDSAEDLGTEKLDGVEVRVFKASRIEPTSGFPEEVQVWVGTRDGLPRKATFQVRQPGSTLQQILDLLYENPDFTESGGVLYSYNDDPVVVRGDEPAETIIRWTYTFDKYNEPVDIQVPVVGDESR